jgi:hypothetical protein
MFLSIVPYASVTTGFMNLKIAETTIYSIGPGKHDLTSEVSSERPRSSSRLMLVAFFFHLHCICSRLYVNHLFLLALILSVFKNFT